MKKLQHLKQRITALGLVAIMSATGLFGAVEAARPRPRAYSVGNKAPETQKVELSFDSNNRNETIIRGDLIQVNASNTKDRVEQNPPIYLYSQTVGNPGNKNDLFDIAAPDKSIINIRPKSKKELGSEEAAVGSYELRSNYGDMAWKADQAFLKGSNINGEFVLLDDSGKNGFNILANSEMTIQYDGHGFKIEGEPTGAFRTFEKNKVTVEKYDAGSGTGSALEKWVLVFYEKSGEVEMSRRVEFTPHYQAEVKNEDTTDDPDDTKVVYNLPVGSEYQILYTYSPSYTLTLTVKDPAEVLQERAEACIDSDLKKNEFVKPQNEGDSDQFITGNIDLKNMTTRYHQDIRLTWTWEPENPEDANVVSISQEGKKGFSLARVSRKEKDVKGNLVVSAAFVTSKLNEDVPNGCITKKMPITIHGKGIPASIKEITGYVGSLSGQDQPKVLKKAEEEKLPSLVQMDVYDNKVEGAQETEHPHMVAFQINMGKENGLAKQMKIELLQADGEPYTGDGVTAVLSAGGEDQEYALNSVFDNSKGSGAQDVTLKLFAKSETKRLLLRFRFYVQGPGSAYREELSAQCEVPLDVMDTTPSKVAKLEDLIIRNNGKTIENFTFDKTGETEEYHVELPYRLNDKDGETMQLTLRPETIKDCSNIVGVTVYTKDKASALYGEADEQSGWPDKATMKKEWKENDAEGKPSLNSGETLNVEIRPDQQLKVEFKVRAQHPQFTKTYTIYLYRALPSDDASLKELHIKDEAGKEYLSGFSADKNEYTVTVPYGTKYLQVQQVTNQEAAILQTSEPQLAKREGKNKDKPEWMNLQEITPEQPGTLKLTILAEDGKATRTYTVTVNKDVPDEESRLQSLDITGVNGGKVTVEPAFHSDMAEGDYYEVRVPFAVDTLKLTAQPMSPLATMELLYHSLAADGTEDVMQDVQVEMNATNAFDVPLPIIRDPKAYFAATITVTAEDGATKTVYPLHIFREPPKKIATLENLAVQDSVTHLDVQKVPDSNYYFETEKYDYEVSVPYEMETLTFTPTATPDMGIRKITVDGTVTKDGNESRPCKIDATKPTSIVITVYPEDPDEKIAPPQEYTVTVTRRPPSSEARLEKLVLENGENMKPDFLPDTLTYEVDVKLGAEGLIVDALPAHPYATMKINGLPVEQGEKSELIKFLEVEGEVAIEVTAQDGVTVLTYLIKVTDQNKIERTNNADLKSLRVVGDGVDGVMTPKFTPAVTEYDVAVTEETYDVQLYPVVDDPLATMKVYAGSKEIGDQKGNFRAAIIDGENTFKVEVTSPDRSATKEYNIKVYRNEEEKMNVLKPITVEDVNYDLSDPIVVDISKYGRVTAPVLIKLRDEYPDKTIVFEGNDYSLSMHGWELSKNIPETEIYDFRLKFECDEIPEVEQLIGADPSNAGMQVVHLHFAHHGDLPAPTTLMLSLGQIYGNKTIYWHYYNKERDRIDYYGSVSSNQRGTIALKMTHMSHYIATVPHSIVGAEDRSGQIGLAPTNGGPLSGSGKPNPNTGVR